MDLGPELDGPVFGPLRDPAAFAQARLDPELRTVAWPNGADFAPEFLRGLVIEAAAQPRAGWAEAARAAARSDNALLDPPTPTRFDDEEWTWQRQPPSRDDV